MVNEIGRGDENFLEGRYSVTVEDIEKSYEEYTGIEEVEMSMTEYVVGEKTYGLYCVEAPYDYQYYYILGNVENQLEVLFASDGWSRRYWSFEESGIVSGDGNCGGSGGSHRAGNMYFLDEKGKVHLLAEYEGKLLEDYAWDVYGTSDNILSDYTGYDDEGYFYIHSEIVDGTKYYFIQGEGKSEEKCKQLLNVVNESKCCTDGCMLNTKEELNKVIVDYARSIGYEAEDFSYTYWGD